MITLKGFILTSELQKRLHINHWEFAQTGGDEHKRFERWYKQDDPNESTQALVWTNGRVEFTGNPKFILEFMMLMDNRLHKDELAAIKSALTAVYSLKYQAEARANTHMWDSVITTLEQMIKKGE